MISMDDWELQNFANAYRNWLESSVGGSSHRVLFDILYDTEYVWWMERDGDRASDGIRLRARFEYESGLPCPEGWDDWPCSFLEFMVAMAYTMEESIMYDPGDGLDMSTWFWTMMDNCGLSSYSDERIFASGTDSYYEIDAILHGIMDREYSYDGVGGLFPLKHPSRDQRNVEYWVQMNAYVLENSLV